MSLMEETEFPFFEFPIFRYCPKTRAGDSGDNGKISKKAIWKKQKNATTKQGKEKSSLDGTGGSR